MYESVTGRLAVREPGRCVVETGGFGYVVHVPASTAQGLPAPGAEVRLLLHLVVPERGGEWRLFGFASDDERQRFRACLGVTGIGPAIALAIVAGLSAGAFRTAIATGDTSALLRVKGVGRKTAERLVVELRGALPEPATADGVPGSGDARPAAGPVEEALAALVALGLDASEAAERLRRIPDAATRPVADLVRRALRAR